MDCKEIQPVHSEGDRLWDFFGRRCIGILESLPAHEPFSYVPKEAKITEAVEPWYPGALTGRAVTRCGFCTTQIERKDKFCRFCGRKLII